jgi:AraC-like DNA-binding protein
MPQKRQPGKPADSEFLVRSLALGLPAGVLLDEHSHEWPQFVYTMSGVLTVTVESAQRRSAWVVPSHRGVWMPARLQHRLETTGTVSLRTLYLCPSLWLDAPTTCCAVGVTPLLRELTLEIVSRRMLRSDLPQDARLARVLVDQLATTPEVPLELCWPRDPRARRMASVLQADLATNIPLADLAAEIGASVRTLERCFADETGATLGQWRLRARLLHALRMLASGDSVTSVALAVGYESTSAFIASFKRTFGETPGNYFHASK